MPLSDADMEIEAGSASLSRNMDLPDHGTSTPVDVVNLIFGLFALVFGGLGAFYIGFQDGDTLVLITSLLMLASGAKMTQGMLWGVGEVGIDVWDRSDQERWLTHGAHGAVVVSAGFNYVALNELGHALAPPFVFLAMSTAVLGIYWAYVYARGPKLVRARGRLPDGWGQKEIEGSAGYRMKMVGGGFSDDDEKVLDLGRSEPPVNIRDQFKPSPPSMRSFQQDFGGSMSGALFVSTPRLMADTSSPAADLLADLAVDMGEEMDLSDPLDDIIILDDDGGLPEPDVATSSAPKAGASSPKSRNIEADVPKQGAVEVKHELVMDGATLGTMVTITNHTAGILSEIEFQPRVSSFLHPVGGQARMDPLDEGESGRARMIYRPRGGTDRATMGGALRFYNYSIKSYEQIQLPELMVDLRCPELTPVNVTEEEWAERITQMAMIEEATEVAALRADKLFHLITNLTLELNLYTLPATIVTGQSFGGSARFYGRSGRDFVAAKIAVLQRGDKATLVISTWSERRGLLLGFYFKLVQQMEDPELVQEMMTKSKGVQVTMPAPTTRRTKLVTDEDFEDFLQQMDEQEDFEVGITKCQTCEGIVSTDWDACPWCQTGLQ